MDELGDCGEPVVAAVVVGLLPVSSNDVVALSDVMLCPLEPIVELAFWRIFNTADRLSSALVVVELFVVLRLLSIDRVAEEAELKLLLYWPNGETNDKDNLRSRSFSGLSRRYSSERFNTAIRVEMEFWLTIAYENEWSDSDENRRIASSIEYNGDVTCDMLKKQTLTNHIDTLDSETYLNVLLRRTLSSSSDESTSRWNEGRFCSRPDQSLTSWPSLSMLSHKREFHTHSLSFHKSEVTSQWIKL